MGEGADSILKWDGGGAISWSMPDKGLAVPSLVWPVRTHTFTPLWRGLLAVTKPRTGHE
jgi:hypothetical protein